MIGLGKLRKFLAPYKKTSVKYKKLDNKKRRFEAWKAFFNYQNINPEHFCYCDHPNFVTKR